MSTQMQTFLAKALYDNLAESPDELAFRRGDIVTVLEVDTDGLEGWYLCSLHNKQGIAPGNRLKRVSGMSRGEGARQRRSLDSAPTQVMSPQKPSDAYTNNKTPHTPDYDVPSTRSVHTEPYTVQTMPRAMLKYNPKTVTTGIDYDTPSKNANASFGNAPNVPPYGTRSKQPYNQVDYDTPIKNFHTSPLPHGGVAQLDYDTPTSNLNADPRSSRQRDEASLDYDTPQNRNIRANDSRFSTGNDNLDYDTPSARNTRCSLEITRGSASPDRSSFLSVDSAATFASNYSLLSDGHSQMTSGIGSARSSFGVTANDFYDGWGARMGASRDSGLDQDYDQPKGTHVGGGDGEDYDVPRLDDSAYESPKITTLQTTRAANQLPRSRPDSLDYDSPRSQFTKSINDDDRDYDSPKSHYRSSVDEEEYDIPPSPRWCQTDVSDQDTLKAQKHGSVYDVPPQVTRDSFLSNRSDSSNGLDDSRLSTSSLDSSFDLSCFSYTDLPLALDSAMDRLVKLQQDVKKCALNLLSRVSSNWRRREVMETRLFDVKQSCVGLVAALRAFVEFSQGALANSTKVADKKLTKKLYVQLQSLRDSFERINNSVVNLDLVNWNLMYLVEQRDSERTDDLGVVIQTSKGVMNEVRKIASTIQGNSSLLFRKSYDNTNVETSPAIELGKPSVAPKPMRMTPQAMQQRPLPNVPDESQTKDDDTLKKSSKKLFSEKDISGIIDEYDYVHLSSRKIVSDRKSNNDDSLSYDEISAISGMENSTVKVENSTVKTENSVGKPENAFSKRENSAIKLEHNDRQVLMFYDKQIETLIDELEKTADAFFGCIERNSPPREFVAYGKLVIVSAHKLVYTGDTMHQNVMHRLVRETIMSHANRLCDALKTSVTATKTAALQYPSVLLVQAMVDGIVTVSRVAKQLSAYIRQTAVSCAAD